MLCPIRKKFEDGQGKLGARNRPRKQGCNQWQRLLRRDWILDTGYWILETGYWILDTRDWILDTGYWILDTRWWLVDN
jgi:hypothetical protein